MIQNAIILQAVQEKLGKQAITESDILSITELDLSRKSLFEVSDLSRFRNLEKLLLMENCLCDLSPISELVSLKELRAGNDPFLPDDEKAARKGKNHFDDYAFLRKLTNLTHVEFTDTDIENIAFVAMLPNVVEFWAYSNPIRDVSPLTHCPKLYKAYFYDCPITDISVCRQLPALCGIAVNSTGVSDLSPLKGHDDFTYLDAHDSRVTDISAVRAMTKMSYLTLAGTKVTDITPLLPMQKLQWLTLEVKNYLSFGQLMQVLPKLRKLKSVALHNCDLTKSQRLRLKLRMPLKKIKFNAHGAL